MKKETYLKVLTVQESTITGLSYWYWDRVLSQVKLYEQFAIFYLSLSILLKAVNDYETLLRAAIATLKWS
jgi:hypothetical protein